MLGKKFKPTAVIPAQAGMTGGLCEWLAPSIRLHQTAGYSGRTGGWLLTARPFKVFSSTELIKTTKTAHKFSVRPECRTQCGVSKDEWKITTALLYTFFALLLIPTLAHAGAQQYEPLALSIKTALSASIADAAPPRIRIDNIKERLAYLEWLGELSERLKKRLPDYQTRRDLLETVYYEAKRAGLEPALVLGLMQVESGFRKHAISSAGARGYTQVMPFWAKLIGDGDASKLFNMQTNIRFGCVILRHYLNIENGDLFRALGRFNGSLGKADYPNLVLGAWKKWEYQPQGALEISTPAR